MGKLESICRKRLIQSSKLPPSQIKDNCNFLQANDNINNSSLCFNVIPVSFDVLNIFPSIGITFVGKYLSKGT